MSAHPVIEYSDVVQARVIARILQVKEIDFEAYEYESDPAIVCQIQNLPIIGIIPIITYLDARYPAPPICIGSSQAIAVQLSLVHQYFDSNPYPLNELITAVEHASPWILGKRISILDLLMDEHLDLAPEQYRRKFLDTFEPWPNYYSSSFWLDS
jgi:hypothetical protein